MRPIRLAVDAAAAAGLLAGIIWLGALVHHNRFGGHAAGAGVESPAPDIVVATDLDGNSAVLHPRARPTLMFVLSVDCPYCAQTMPIWKSIVETLDHRGMEQLHITVLSTSSSPRTRDFLESYGLAVDTLIVGAVEVQALGLPGVPGTVAAGPGRDKIRRWIGVLSEEERDSIIAWSEAVGPPLATR